jgi:hypothetical protein
MMAGDSEMREYRPADLVRLLVTVQDPSGVQQVTARAFREETGPSANEEEQILLAAPGSEGGFAPVDNIVLQGRVRTQTPGVYICDEITATDTLGNSKTTPLTSPRRFRIVESAEEDREGPEILEVGEFY